MPANVAIIIPARLAAVRLPNKPLLDIAGKPMILRVAEQALASGIEDIFIACGDQAIYDLAIKHSFKAVMTDPSLPSGSDRIYAAYKKLNLKHDYIINLQGDLPTISPEIIRQVYDECISSGADIATAVSRAQNRDDASNSSIVKAVIGFNNRALYFTRSICPWGDGELYYHLGIYCYRKDALEKFMNSPATLLEQREKLEQLRALENGLSISTRVVDTFPQSVDTIEDLESVRKCYS